MSNSKMISVIMGIYNEKLVWLKESIESILNQTYRDIELILIVDNPDLDNETLKYLEIIEREDFRVKLLINEKNMGIALSFNKALEFVNGKYIARMDADDISLPDRFEKELKYLSERKIDVVASEAWLINENGNIIGKKESMFMEINEKVLEYTNPIIHPSVLMTKEALISVAGYRNFRRSQDYDLWLRIISKNYRIEVIKEKLIKYRVSSQQASYLHKLEQYYVHRYQLKLHKQRKKRGSDSFSEENLEKYLRKKHITTAKNIKFIKALENIDAMKKSRVIKKMILLVEAILLSPFTTIYGIWTRVKRTLS